MPDSANETLTADEFREKYGGPSVDQATVELGDNYRKVVAVDPGASTGVAVKWGGQVNTYTLDFWQVYRRAVEASPSDESLYVVEAPYKTGVTHQRLIDDQQRLLPQLKVAQNAGGVQREAELLVAGLRRLAYDVVEHEPSTSKKWDHEALEGLIGEWNGPSNEHTRDALMMLVAYGFLP
jgi:hypothetical protein